MKKKNVLLLCLSPVNTTSKANVNTYSYECKGEEQFVSGFMTNEAPTKSVIEKLCKNNKQKLDEIILICSETVRNNKIGLRKDGQLDSAHAEKIAEFEKEIYGEATGILAEKTHLECYKEVISHFIRQHEEDFGDNYIVDENTFYREIQISDTPNAMKISNAVVEAANEVKKQDDKEVDLYIDFNGGQRYVAFMILSISNLMKIRNVNIKEIMTMNYENGKKLENGKSIIPIENFNPVFESIDLVTGIKEYVNYGRIKTLKNYFKSSKTEEIHKILHEMEQFSNYLQLCRTEYIFENKEKLGEMLKNYMEAQKQKQNENLDSYEILFTYVAEDILREYAPLLAGDLPAVIRWCLDKEFIQQALTFYAERMPIYFWDKKICMPSKTEEKEYNQFLQELKTNHTLGKEMGKYYRGDKKYNWLISYLPNSYKDKKEGNKKNNWQKYQNKVDERLYKNISVKALKQAKQNASEIMKYTQTKFCRVDKMITDLKLETLLVDYFLIKSQRNFSNHASDENEVAGVMWNYEQTCQILDEALKRIGK